MAIFSAPVFCQWLFVYARTWICCKTLAKLKFSVNAWDREANFLYQDRASRSNNDVFAHSHSRNASKQLFRFRFMPSQFETHGAAASRTQAEGTAHHVHHRRTARTSSRSSQNVSRRPRHTPRSRSRCTNRPRSRRGSPKPSHDQTTPSRSAPKC